MSTYKAEDLDAIQILYCTASLGMHPSHGLQRKLEAISKAGFTGIELGFDDLVSFAKSSENVPNLKNIPSFHILEEIDADELDDKPEHDQEKYYGVLKIVSELVVQHCHHLKLEIFCLQPFAMFEGYDDEEKKRKNMYKAKKWLELAHVLGCKALQVRLAFAPFLTLSLPLVQKMSDTPALHSSTYANPCTRILDMNIKNINR